MKVTEVRTARSCALAGFALKEVTKIFAGHLIFHHQVVHPVL